MPRTRTKKIAKIVLVVLAIVVLAVGLLASRIYSFRTASSDAQADAAVVLGAAVWTANVSPVFRERINHGIGVITGARCGS